MQVFQALWRSYGSEEAFLAQHAEPALVLEPFLEEESTHLTRPGAALGSSINDLLKAQGAVGSETDAPNPLAGVMWLEKSTRNPFKSLITIGRGTNNDIIILNPTLSKVHAVFHREADGSYTVSDRNSTNGTFVNGVQLEPSQPTPVGDGDLVRFGAEIAGLFCAARTLWTLIEAAKRVESTCGAKGLRPPSGR